MPGGFREHESKGERVVFCTRADCAHRTDAVAGQVGFLPSGHVWYLCEAGVLVMDRRAKFGNTCARFNQRGDKAAT
jgi:hypothetical protein